VGYCYPSGLEKTLCKWDIYVPLVTKGLRRAKEQEAGKNYMKGIVITYRSYCSVNGFSDRRDG
jgi:hypothetical protein